MMARKLLIEKFRGILSLNLNHIQPVQDVVDLLGSTWICSQAFQYQSFTLLIKTKLYYRFVCRHKMKTQSEN